jgi:thiamine-monophosphate kinase
LPRNTSEDFLKELTRGAKTCALKFNTRIMGGDTKETKEITLCGTALGLVKKEEFMPRKGAKPGDIVAVTGTLGKAGAAYYSKDKTPLLEPIPRLKEGRVLASQKCVTSSIDISDGLSSSLYQLKEINEVGFEIDFNLLPISPNVAESIALHFGGDYELLVTIPASRFSKVRKEMNKNGLNLFPIGRVTEEKEIVIVKKKKRKILEDKGYQHFTNV